MDAGYNAGIVPLSPRGGCMKKGNGKIAVSQRQAIAMGKTPAQGEANRANSPLQREAREKSGGRAVVSSTKSKKGC